MRLSTFSALRRDREHVYLNSKLTWLSQLHRGLQQISLATSVFILGPKAFGNNFHHHKDRIWINYVFIKLWLSDDTAVS